MLLIERTRKSFSQQLKLQWEKESEWERENRDVRFGGGKQKQFWRMSECGSLHLIEGTRKSFSHR